MTVTVGTIAQTHVLNFPVITVRNRDAMRTEAEQGQIVSRTLQTSVSRNTGKLETLQLEVLFGPITTADKDALFALWNLALGQVFPVLFQAPGLAEIPYFFEQDKFTSTWLSAGLYTVRLRLREDI